MTEYISRRRFFALIVCVVLCLTAFPCASPAEAALPGVSGGVISMVPTGEYPELLSSDEGLKVFCIPVGAQDCYLIICDGHAMMLDCAAPGREPTPDFLPLLLDALGIDEFDFVINTHPHRDHINGFVPLLQRVPAKEFITVFPLDYDRLQRVLIKDVTELNIPIRQYKAGEPLALGKAQISTYRYRKSLNTNDLSLVVHIRYGERAILFTADIGLTAQRKMAVEYGDKWRADILKLPHHGIGGLAKELYEATSPEMCFASNGSKSKSVKLMREFLQKRGTPLLYTSREPLVMLTDGKLWQVQQWRPDAIELPELTIIPEQTE